MILLAHPSLSEMTRINQFSQHNIGVVSLREKVKWPHKYLKKLPSLRKVVMQLSLATKLVFKIWKMQTQYDIIIVLEVFPLYMFITNILLWPLNRKIMFVLNQAQQAAFKSFFHRIAFIYFKMFRFGSILFEVNDSVLPNSIRIREKQKLIIPHPVTFFNSSNYSLKKQTVVFGLFGKSRKGKILNLSLARQVKNTIERLPKCCSLKIGLPTWDVNYKKFKEEGFEVLATNSDDEYRDFLASIDISIQVFEKDEYFFRASGSVMDAICSGCHIICSDYPVIRHEVMWPNRVGTSFNDTFDLSRAMEEALGYISSSKKGDYEKHYRERSAERIAQYIDDFVDTNIAKHK